MQRRWIPAIILAASAFALAPTAMAGAAGQPNQVTGQPNDSCQAINTYPGETTPHGGAMTSPGAPFNEVSGKGGAAYTAGNAHSPQTNVAVSQYDVACANQPTNP